MESIKKLFYGPQYKLVEITKNEKYTDEAYILLNVVVDTLISFIERKTESRPITPEALLKVLNSGPVDLGIKIKEN